MARITSPGCIPTMSAGPLGDTPETTIPSCRSVGTPINHIPIRGSAIASDVLTGGAEIWMGEVAATSTGAWAFPEVPMGIGSNTTATLIFPVELLRLRFQLL